MSQERYEGFVTDYVRERGFGFIKSDAFPDKDLWFHFTFIEGAQDSALYKILNDIDREQELKSNKVSFIVRKDYRGLQAVNIRLYDDELSPIARISDFIRSPISTQEKADDEFYKLATMVSLAYVDSNATIRDLVISRIVRSPQLWEELANVAKQWWHASELFRRSLTWARNDTEFLAEFVATIARILRLQPLSGFDFVPKNPPFVIQPLIPLKTSPLKNFREADSFSLIVFLNEEALFSFFDREPSFVEYTKKSIKLIVLLDEKEVGVNLEKYKPLNIALIRQMNIIQNIVSYRDKDDPIVIGRTFREIFPLDWMKPYEVGSQYDGAIFVGRMSERNSVLQNPENNHAVYGGRKIGKTWFLKEVCHWCEREPYHSIYAPVYVSLQAAENIEDATTLILEAVERKGYTLARKTGSGIARVCNTLVKIHEGTGKVVLLALDEIDDVLRMQDSYKLFGRLRQLQDTYPGTVKFLFAGFKWLIHALYDEPSNNPFANFKIGKNHFSLGCLSQEELHNLVVEPLRWVGLEFNEDEIVGKFYELASGHPYYTQSLCQGIINSRVKQNARILSSQNIDKLATEEFFDDVTEIFLKNLSPLQMLIGKIFADRQGAFSEEDIITALNNRFGINMTIKELRDEMKVLQACSVFARTAEGYCPVVQRINQEFFCQQDDEELALLYMMEKSSGI